MGDKVKEGQNKSIKAKGSSSRGWFLVNAVGSMNGYRGWGQGAVLDGSARGKRGSLTSSPPRPRQGRSCWWTRPRSSPAEKPEQSRDGVPIARNVEQHIVHCNIKCTAPALQWDCQLIPLQPRLQQLLCPHLLKAHDHGVADAALVHGHHLASLPEPAADIRAGQQQWLTALAENSVCHTKTQP